MKGLSSARKTAGMTQAEFASKIGVDRSTVTKWERGSAYPSADKLPEIAAALGCTIDDLYNVPA